MRTGFLIGVALAAVSSPAAAQLAGGATAPADLSPRYELRATASVSYDSNVLQLPEQFNPPNFSRDDIRFTPAVTADVARPLGRQTLFVNGSVGYDFYANNSRLNRERIGLVGGAVLRAGSSCSATTTLGYQRQQVDFINVFQASPQPNTREERSLDVQARCAGTVGLTPSAGFRRFEVRNTAPIFRLFDVNGTSYNVGLGYQRPSLGTITLFGTYATSVFTGRDVLGLSDRLDNYSVGVSFERRIGTRITGVISAGFSWVDPNLPDVERFRGANYSASLLIVPTDNFRVSLEAARSIDVQTFAAAAYAISDSYQLSGSYQLARNLRLNFGSSYRKQDFQTGGGIILIPGFFVVPAAENVTGNVGFSYDLTQRIVLTGQFQQSRRISDVDFFNANNSRLIFTASLRL